MFDLAPVRTLKADIAGIGTSVLLVTCVVALLLAAGSLVGFRGWHAPLGHGATSTLVPRSSLGPRPALPAPRAERPLASTRRTHPRRRAAHPTGRVSLRRPARPAKAPVLRAPTAEQPVARSPRPVRQVTPRAPQPRPVPTPVTPHPAPAPPATSPPASPPAVAATPSPPRPVAPAPAVPAPVRVLADVETGLVGGLDRALHPPVSS
jgi:hypothetical protein